MCSQIGTSPDTAGSIRDALVSVIMMRSVFIKDPVVQGQTEEKMC